MLTAECFLCTILLGESTRQVPSLEGQQQLNNVEYGALHLVIYDKILCQIKKSRNFGCRENKTLVVNYAQVQYDVSDLGSPSISHVLWTQVS
jgi:hypothetical protein